MTRKFSSISVQTTLATGVSNTALTIPVAVGTGATLMGGVSLAGGNVDQYSILIDPNLSTAEIMWVTGVSGDNLTVLRGKDGTSAVAHNAGAVIQHILTAGDLTYLVAAAGPTADLANTGLPFPGSTSGTTTVKATAVAGTNTLTLPATNSDTLVAKNTTDLLKNKTLDDASVTFVDTADNTKAVKVDVTGTTGITGILQTIFTTAKTLIFPDASDTLVGQATTDTLTNKTLTDAKINQAVNAQTGTTFTPALTDNNKIVTLNNAAAIAVTIPTNASVAYPVGARIDFAWITGAGQPTISAVTPGTTTILSGGGTSTAPKIRAVNLACTAIKIATDVWLVVGDIV